MFSVLIPYSQIQCGAPGKVQPSFLLFGGGGVWLGRTRIQILEERKSVVFGAVSRLVKISGVLFV
jgi:hypothetical protein